MDEEEVTSTTVDESDVGNVSTSSTASPDSVSVIVKCDSGTSTATAATESSLNLNQKKRKSTDGDEDEVTEVAPGGSASPLATIADVEANGSNPVQVQDMSEIPETPAEPEEPEVQVDLRVMFNKQLIPVRISLKKTVGDLKRVLEKTTDVPPDLQKILIKGIPKDDVRLETLGITAGSKVLVIGSKLTDILSVSKPILTNEPKGSKEGSTAETQNWCSQPRHQKIVGKGVPDDAMPGILEVKDPLPQFPLSGMLGSKGSKVRLTFKLEADELWIGTKERTDKVPIGSIRHVVSQPITGFEHYHIMALQLGPTEASRLFIYWVPAQFISAIKNALGA